MFTTNNVTGECALGSYMWTDEHPHVRSPFAVNASNSFKQLQTELRAFNLASKTEI
jgi:hypothetical protein